MSAKGFTASASLVFRIWFLKGLKISQPRGEEGTMESAFSLFHQRRSIVVIPDLLPDSFQAFVSSCVQAFIHPDLPSTSYRGSGARRLLPRQNSMSEHTVDPPISPPAPPRPWPLGMDLPLRSRGPSQFPSEERSQLAQLNDGTPRTAASQCLESNSKRPLVQCGTDYTSRAQAPRPGPIPRSPPPRLGALHARSLEQSLTQSVGVSIEHAVAAAFSWNPLCAYSIWSPRSPSKPGLATTGTCNTW